MKTLTNTIKEGQAIKDQNVEYALFHTPQPVTHSEKLDILQKDNRRYVIQNTRRYGQRITLTHGEESSSFVCFESPVKYGLVPLEYYQISDPISDWAGVFEECWMNPFFPTVQRYEEEKTQDELCQEGYQLIGKIHWRS